MTGLYTDCTDEPSRAGVLASAIYYTLLIHDSHPTINSIPMWEEEEEDFLSYLPALSRREAYRRGLWMTGLLRSDTRGASGGSVPRCVCTPRLEHSPTSSTYTSDLPSILSFLESNQHDRLPEYILSSQGKIDLQR